MYMNDEKNKEDIERKINNKKQQSANNIKEEIKENYKIGIEYYEDVEEHQD